MCLVDGGLETDQYMLGDDLLVAPINAGVKTRTVRLPKGKWYDYMTGQLVGESESISISPKLNEIPLYVRGGRAIPTSGRESNMVRCYGSGPWVGELYQDSGEGYEFERGDYGVFDLLVDTEAVPKHRSGSRRTAAGQFTPVFVGQSL
jgi:alpha-D-xyloside xylohydrolase